MYPFFKTTKNEYYFSKITIKKSFFCSKKVKFNRLNSSFSFYFKHKNSVSVSKSQTNLIKLFGDFSSSYNSQTSFQNSTKPSTSLAFNTPVTVYSTVFLKTFKFLFQNILTKKVQIFSQYKTFIFALANDVKHFNRFNNSVKFTETSPNALSITSLKESLSSVFDSQYTIKINHVVIPVFFYLNIKPFTPFLFKFLYNSTLSYALIKLLKRNEKFFSISKALFQQSHLFFLSYLLAWNYWVNFSNKQVFVPFFIKVLCHNTFFYKEIFSQTGSLINVRGLKFTSLIRGRNFFSKSSNQTILNHFLADGEKNLNKWKNFQVSSNFSFLPKNLRKNRKNLYKVSSFFGLDKLSKLSNSSKSFFILKPNKSVFFSYKAAPYILSRLESKLSKLNSEPVSKAFLRAYNLYKILNKKNASQYYLTKSLLVKKKRLLIFRKKQWRVFFKKNLVNLLKLKNKKEIYVLVKYLFDKLTKISKVSKLTKFNNINLVKVKNLVKNLRLNLAKKKIKSHPALIKTNLLNKTSQLLIKNVAKESKTFYQKNLKRANSSIIKLNSLYFQRLNSVKLKNAKLRSKLFFNKSNYFEDILKKRSSKLKKKRFNKAIRLSESFVKLNETQNALGIFFSKKVSFFFVNALSFAKYAYKLERLWKNKKVKSPTGYLANLDRFFINKYKYIGIFIKDFIRINFIGMLLKKPAFITRFIAFLIAKLPRNRRETSFIRYMMRVLKIFSAEREEIEALRIKFKGRVNRWRRTKSLVGHRGTLPLSTFENRIIFGSSQAINRKGAIGVSLWIQYNTGFFKEGRASFGFYYKQFIRFSFIKYIKYSQKKVKFLKNYLPFVLKARLRKTGNFYLSSKAKVKK